MNNRPYQFNDVAPAFPLDLKQLTRWIVRTADKHPFSPFEEDDSLGPIDPHDEKYQAEYDTALGALEQTTRYSGLGFVFNYKDGLTGVDFDDCVDAETRQIRPDIQAILTRLDSYAEFSPSGTGIHCIVTGWQFPIGPMGQEGAKVGKAEMYSGKRYFTVTGDHVPGTPDTVNSRSLDWLHERIVKNREFVVTKPAVDGVACSSESSCVVCRKTTVITSKYETLMTGTIIRSKETDSADFAIEDDNQTLSYESQSSADYALLRLITDKLQTEDPEVIKTEFLKSPLGERDKATHGNYLDRTIKKLLASSRIRINTADQTGSVIGVETKIPNINLAAKQPGGAVGPIGDMTGFEEEVIPEFDPSVITGIYKEIVNLVCDGTTIPRQYVFLAAKVYLGARMAAGVSFEGLDCDSRYYGTVIGETGTGKGLSWRRFFNNAILINGKDDGQNTIDPLVKVLNSADSGAGLRDAFFDHPATYPAILYIDEVSSLGQKARDDKQVEIVQVIGELADSTQVSRVLAAGKGRPKAIKTGPARLAMYCCGQDGDVYVSSFPGRGKLGLFDRFYPEYSGLVEAGDLPSINHKESEAVRAKIESLKFAAQMTMGLGVKTGLDDFWNGQPARIKGKVRFKKHLMLDMYLTAFGEGRLEASLADLDLAVRIFNRQMVIRRLMFTFEAPDRLGYYTGLFKKIIDSQRDRLNAGQDIRYVAMSLRDIQSATNAFRYNELVVFNRAWKDFQAHIVRVQVIGSNGHRYEKFVPMPYENEMWLPL